MKLHVLEQRPSARPTALFVGSSHDWIRSAWMVSCLVGAAVGMTLSAAIAVVVRIYFSDWRYGPSRDVAVELIVLTAVLEGALIGYFQWRVLRRLFPTMTSMAWVGATILAAGSGCILSWLPTSFAFTGVLANTIGDVTLRPALIVEFTLVTGAFIGLVWGVAQYAVLRMHVHRAGLWILASVGSWAMVFGWLYLAAVFPDRTTLPVVQIGLGTLAGFILGAALGLLQGWVLAGLKSRLLGPADSKRTGSLHAQPR